MRVYIGLNFSLNNSVKNPADSGAHITEAINEARSSTGEGYAINSFWAFKADHLFITQEEYGSHDKSFHNPPLLYNLDEDPSEKYKIAKENPKLIATEMKNTSQQL